MNVSNERSSKPFKKIDCTRRNFLRMPGNALKIWLYYYTREGKERLAWASEEELCAATDLNRDTMRKWRNWLVKNGWLKLMGHRDAKTGEFAVAIYRVKEGTAAESFGDGRSRNIPSRCSRNFQSPSQPKFSATAAAESFGEEVEPKRQVDSQRQVEPFEVGVSESVSELVSEAAPPPPSCLANQTQTPETLTPQVGEAEEKEKTKPRSRYANLNSAAQTVVMNLYPGWIPGDLGVDAAQLNSVAAQQSDSGLDWNEFFVWHRAHKPPKLIFRDATRFLAGWEYAVNDYAAHDPETCAVCLKLGKQQQYPHGTFVRCDGCGGCASPKYKDEDFCEKCYPKYSRAAAGLPLIAEKPCACGDKRGEGHIGFCTAEV